MLMTRKSTKKSRAQQMRDFLFGSIKNMIPVVLLVVLYLALHGNKMLSPRIILGNSIFLLNDPAEKVYMHVMYLWKLMYPWNLSCDYDSCIPDVTSYASAAGSALLAIALIGFKRRNAVMMWGLSLLVLPLTLASVGGVLKER